MSCAETEADDAINVMADAVASTSRRLRVMTAVLRDFRIFQTMMAGRSKGQAPGHAFIALDYA
jgi:hypothetical protein